MTIYENAVKIVRTLRAAGYTAYFAGGWVRDYILSHPSDDIDIATDAPPDVVIKLFPHTIPVGVAFGVVIVLMEGHQYEVATFRTDLEYTGGRRPDKIHFSSPQEDALRRDFTINGMFYDPIEDVIYDYVGGREDLKKGIIRTIGNADERFVEDRLRMLRAIRFATRFNFHIDEETQKAILENAHTLLPAVAMERIWQEFNKLSKFPRFDKAIIEMHRLGLLPTIFPELQKLPLETVAERVSLFKEFPQETPPILYIMELFPEMSVEELLEVCQYLRTSMHEGKLVEFAHKGKTLLAKEEESAEAISNKEWAYFYADRFFRVCFDIIHKRYPENLRSEIVERHAARHERLLPHIMRIADRKPLVTASILMELGIQPGRTMGALLKAAEDIALSQDLHDANAIINKLKESDLWPKTLEK